MRLIKGRIEDESPPNVAAEIESQRLRLRNTHCPLVTRRELLRQLADQIEVEAEEIARFGAAAQDVVKNLCHFVVVLRALSRSFSV